MHHSIEFHLRLTFSKILGNRKLPVNTHTYFSEVHLHTCNSGHYLTARKLDIILLQCISSYIFISQSDIGCDRGLPGTYIVKTNHITTG